MNNRNAIIAVAIGIVVILVAVGGYAYWNAHNNDSDPGLVGDWTADSIEMIDDSGVYSEVQKKDTLSITSVSNNTFCGKYLGKEIAGTCIETNVMDIAFTADVGNGNWVMFNGTFVNGTILASVCLKNNNTGEDVIQYMSTETFYRDDGKGTHVAWDLASDVDASWSHFNGYSYSEKTIVEFSGYSLDLLQYGNYNNLLFASIDNGDGDDISGWMSIVSVNDIMRGYMYACNYDGFICFQVLLDDDSITIYTADDADFETPVAGYSVFTHGPDIRPSSPTIMPEKYSGILYTMNADGTKDSATVIMTIEDRNNIFFTVDLRLDDGTSYSWTGLFINVPKGILAVAVSDDNHDTGGIRLVGTASIDEWRISTFYYQGISGYAVLTSVI